MVYIFEVEVPLSQSSIENITGALIDDKDYEMLDGQLQEVSISKPLFVLDTKDLVPYVQKGIGKDYGDITYEDVFALEEHLSNAYQSAPVSLLKPLQALLEEIPTLLMAAALEGSTLRFIYNSTE
jgi:hypothetical protein